MASIKFLGAVEGVTGSCYLITTNRSSILLDCGLYQGRREEEDTNAKPFAFDPSGIDAVVLSHAHLDHSGRLPLLVSNGYSGQIHMTEPTCALIDVMLKDAASLQVRDAEWENRRRRREGKEEVEPLYDLDDVMTALGMCMGHEYHERIQITDDVAVRFLDAGHILGSAVVELYVTDGGVERKLVFSGDLGNSCAALLRNPETVSTADILLLESTYGDRDHRSMQETMDEFDEVLVESTKDGGNVLIPSFAVGRTQEIIFRLGELYHEGKLGKHAIYLDSPMAVAVTDVYDRYQRMYNEDDRQAMQTYRKHADLQSFLPSLRYTVSTEDSMALNRIEGGAIIIAGSGMCNGGRIRHHLKHNLWRRQAHVVIVGYQAIGTPGRALVDGVTRYRFAGEDVIVRAKIHTLGGFSAHASRSQLLEWLDAFENKCPLYLVHGEEGAKKALRDETTARGWNTRVARLNETVEF